MYKHEGKICALVHPLPCSLIKYTTVVLFLTSWHFSDFLQPVPFALGYFFTLVSPDFHNMLRLTVQTAYENLFRSLNEMWLYESLLQMAAFGLRSLLATEISSITILFCKVSEFITTCSLTIIKRRQYSPFFNRS